MSRVVRTARLASISLVSMAGYSANPDNAWPLLGLMCDAHASTFGTDAHGFARPWEVTVGRGSGSGWGLTGEDDGAQAPWFSRSGEAGVRAPARRWPDLVCRSAGGDEPVV